MCGFYFSNKQPNNDYNFKDVKQRGLESKVFSCNQYFAIQSILPCITNSIDFSIHETEEYLFLYTGQIYNYDREFFNSDTKMFLHDIRAGNSLSHYNGMYAYVYYDKKLDKLKFSRDKTGQIPLFIYQKNGHIVISNTIKSIVETTDAVPNKKCLDLWQKSKHYIFNESPWTDIYSVKPNGLELDYLHTTINDVFKDMKQDYVSPLKSASINSGGVDSGIVSKWFGEFQVAINHQGKDFVSSNLDFAYNINEKQWCE